jgi:hypothetical protein
VRVDAAVARDPVGLDQQASARRQQRSQTPQQPQRVLDPVQDPEAEHNVEALRGAVQRERVAAAVLHARTEQLGDCREALASLQLDPPGRPHPRYVLLVVDEYVRRAAVLGEERVEAVERADVEHLLAGERQRHERNARAMVARDARRVETVLAVERERVKTTVGRAPARVVRPQDRPRWAEVRDGPLGVRDDGPRASRKASSLTRSNWPRF